MVHLHQTKTIGTRNTLCLALVTLACVACSHSTIERPAAQPKSGPPGLASRDAEQARVCQSVARYGEAHNQLLGPSSFGSASGEQSTILFKPSRDTKRINDAAIALARADSETKPSSAESKEVSDLLHQQLETLRHIEGALAARDQVLYVDASQNYSALRRRITAIADQVSVKCGKGILRPDPKGRLRPSVIQAVVRKQYDEFRACYEEGLKRDRSLQGKVVFRFMIDRQGHVSDVEHVASVTSATSNNPDTGTEAFFQALGFHQQPQDSDRVPSLHDTTVVQCLENQYRKLVFPPPEGGIVTVIYPIMFQPNEEVSKDD